MEFLDERWMDLMESMHPELTEEEMDEGWHFCDCWDGLLVGPGMDELDYCTCARKCPPGPDHRRAQE